MTQPYVGEIQLFGFNFNPRNWAFCNGATLPIAVSGGTVMVGDAKVVATDIAASNGVIHVIDTVLIPPM